MIIPFLNIFEEGDKTTDINLIDKLTTPDELSGLFNLSVKHLKNLLERGKFDNEPVIAEKRELYIKKSNPTISRILFILISNLEYNSISFSTSTSGLKL